MGVWSKLKSALGANESAAPVGGSHFVSSRDMQLRVAAPRGWELAEAEPSGPLRAAFRASCDDGVLVLHAKLFLVSDEERRSAEDLERDDWRARWLATTFASIESISVALVGHMLDGFRESACEVQIQGTPKGGDLPLVVRERQLPRKSHLLVLTAAGPKPLYERHLGVIEAWIANSSCG